MNKDNEAIFKYSTRCHSLFTENLQALALAFTRNIFLGKSICSLSKCTLLFRTHPNLCHAYEMGGLFLTIRVFLFG